MKKCSPSSVDYSYRYASDTAITDRDVSTLQFPQTTGTEKTEAQLKALTVALTGTDFGVGNAWSADNWDFGDNTDFPALKSTAGVLICGQPTPRAQCSP